ncbi:MAG: hypothetical protein EAZ24_10545 [Burkholderiales bacterium]|nr:MAG: hypothetical protein EAZ24_10545 [Burkholderiales bacterium]TAG80497.1 MAG: hypothetical protein EAZ21_08030 [Betaproteobacteria bacterium]
MNTDFQLRDRSSIFALWNEFFFRSSLTLISQIDTDFLCRSGVRILQEAIVLSRASTHVYATRKSESEESRKIEWRRVKRSGASREKSVFSCVNLWRKTNQRQSAKSA